MNKPLNHQQVKDLPLGYNPTAFPNRKTRRKAQNNKNKITQMCIFVIAEHRYKQKVDDKILRANLGKYQGLETNFLEVKRNIHHEKNIFIKNIDY